MSSSYAKPTKTSLPPRDAGYPKECDYCFPSVEFYDGAEFARHLRVVHSTKEGGSFVCRYGENNVCQRLPLEGVSDVDYEAHIRRFHTCVEPQLPAPAPSPLPEEKSFTLNSFTQNLSAVLSDPGRKRTEVVTFFTRHWGDTFIPPSSIPPSHLIPPVYPQVFVNYVKSTGKTYKQYKAAKKALHLLRQQNASEEKADADDLPSVFVDPSFLLSHGPTFSAIFTVPPVGEKDPLTVTESGRSIVCATPEETTEGAQPAGSFRSYSSLHSRLESMHDVVDSRLAGKLVSKSSAFWQMVHSYGGLHEHLAAAMHDVRNVRSNLQSVSSLICERTRKVMYLYEQRERKQKLLAKLRDISCLRDAQSTVQMSLNQSDYPKAIDCIETSQDVLEQELAGVQCFRHLGSQLNELYGVIGRMMHEDFAQVIQKEFGTRPEDGTAITYEGELSSVMMGLMQVRKYSFMTVVRTEIGEAIKGIMRQVVKQRIVDSGLDMTQFDPTLSHLGEPVRRLKFADWLLTIQAATDALYTFCCRLQALQDVMCDLADRVSRNRDGDISSGGRGEELSPSSTAASSRLPLTIPSDSPSSEQDDSFLSSSALSNSLSTAGSPSADPSVLIGVEIRSDFHLKRAVNLVAEYGHHCAQMRLTRLLQARTKEVSQDPTSPSELMEVIGAVRQYQKKCSEMGWHRTQPTISSPLSLCLHRLSIEYIDRFHAQRRTKMGEVLDMELWKAAEIPSIFQQIVDQCTKTGKLRNLQAPELSGCLSSLNVDGEQYVIVSSCLMFLRILSDYCECVSSMPSFAPDILSRVVELLKACNSRCCQLILGAGALQLVGLKTISVRNLALASRSLQLVVHFVPVVSKEIESHLVEEKKHLMRHFQQVLSDYSDHITEITSKLASVIDHHTVNCLASWELKGSVPSPAFQLMCRQLHKFHNGLHGIMPEALIRGLFEMVHSNFKNNLKLQLAKIGVTPHDSLTYGFVNQDYCFYTKSIQSMVSCTKMEFESLNEVIYGR